MLPEVMSHQRLEQSNAVSHLPQTLTHLVTRICHQLGHSDVTSVHRVMYIRCCASPMRGCTSNIAQRVSHRVLPRRLSEIVNPGGWNRPTCFPGYYAHYCVQQSAHRTQKVRIAVRALHAQIARAAQTACPLLNCRQHPLSRRKAVPTRKP